MIIKRKTYLKMSNMILKNMDIIQINNNSNNSNNNINNKEVIKSLNEKYIHLRF
jgi:hypothetical protein